jgi:hypothetical protein
VEQWASLEPDNAAPWLLIANAAQSAMAREEAVYKASTAQRFDARLPDFFGLLALPDIRSQAPQTRSAVGDELVGLQMTLPGFPHQPAYRFCNYPSLADVGNRDICSNLAKLFLERDRTIIGLAVGAKLAQSAGWSPDAVNLLRERSARLRDAFAAGVKQQAEQAASDCDELAAFERWAANYSNLGDRGVATKYLEESTARGPVGRQ